MTTQNTQRFKTEREPTMCPDHPSDRLITTTNRTIGESVVYQRLEQHRCGVLHCGRPLNWAWYRQGRDTVVGEGRASDEIRYAFDLNSYSNATGEQCIIAFALSVVPSAVALAASFHNGWGPLAIAGSCIGIAVAFALPILNFRLRKRGRPIPPPGYDYWAASQRSVIGRGVEER